MRTRRCYPLARRKQYALRMRFLVARLAAVADVVDAFPGQGALDKHHFAVDMRNAASLVIQRFDFSDWHEKPERSTRKRLRL